jgi:hypothetical protein
MQDAKKYSTLGFEKVHVLYYPIPPKSSAWSLDCPL